MFAFFFLWPITFPLLIAYVFVLLGLFKKQAYVLLVVAALSPFIAYKAFQYYWFSKVLPPQISISYPISINDEGGFLEGCGTAAFKVSDETLEAIQRDGMKFFSGATQGRGHPNDPYYKYEDWKETPVPPTWTNEGSWMLCSGLSSETHAKIVAAAKQKGAYYTSKPEGQLFLAPSLGYVVFTFFG